jgi:hypothetical protein
MRRLILLVCATAATALLAAVPAAASHHPPNAAPGLVTMSVARQGGELSFNYTVTEQPCPNPHCDVNYGKPYGIAIYLDAPGHTTGVRTSPTLVQADKVCHAQSIPLVSCNEPDRDQTDPNAALPMSAVIKVRVGNYKGATAEIVAVGYSLNTYQEGIPLPPDCSDELADYNATKSVFDDESEKYQDALDELREYTGVGQLAAMLRLGAKSAAILHDDRLDNVLQKRVDVKRWRQNLVESKVNLHNCETARGRPDHRVPSGQPSAATKSGVRSSGRSSSWQRSCRSSGRSWPSGRRRSARRRLVIPSA